MQKPLIVIADDDGEDHFIMEQSFSELGHHEIAKFVTDGNLLIDYLQNSVRIPDLILLDLNMPRLNGSETLKVIKADPRLKDIPVVIFSTSVNEKEKAICLNMGAKEYITKPESYFDYLEVCKKLYAMAVAPAEV